MSSGSSNTSALDDPVRARTQDRMNAVNRFVVGCDCNRSTLDSIGKAGFEITRVEHGELPEAHAFVRPLVVGIATPIEGRRLQPNNSHPQSTRA